MENKDIRWHQRFSNYKKAFARLTAVAVNCDLEKLTELENHPGKCYEEKLTTKKLIESLQLRISQVIPS